MAESKKGHNFATQGPTENKICVRLFFVLMLYIKFQASSSSGSLVLQSTKGLTDRRTDDQTDRRADGQAQTNMPPHCPLNFCKVGGIIRQFTTPCLGKSNKKSNNLIQHDTS